MRVRRTVKDMRSIKSRMFRLKNTAGVATAPDWAVLTTNDWFARIAPSTYYCPTGLRVDTTAGANTDTAIKKFGYTHFPFNACTQKNAIGQFTAQQEQALTLQYQGASFDPVYCVYDYGWSEGSTFAATSKYEDVSVTFGIIKNMQRFKEAQTNLAVDIEEIMNLVLGVPGGRTQMFTHCGFKPRTTGTVNVQGGADKATQALYRTRKLFKSLVVILKTDKLMHRPVVKEGTGGITAVTIADRGRHFGEGSFSFPGAALRKQTLRDNEVGTSAIGFLNSRLYQKNVPFCHVRGCCDAAAIEHTPADATAANKGMHLCMRFKIGIREDLE